MNEQKGRRRSIFKKRRQTIAIHDTLREEDYDELSQPATPPAIVNAPEIRLPTVDQNCRRGSSFIKRASRQIEFESSLPPLRPSIVGRKSRYTNRKSIREDMPDDSILAKIFDLDNWADAERELRRRVTISIGALPTMDLNESDMKALLSCKTWETFNNNDRHHFMIKTKLTDECYDRAFNANCQIGLFIYHLRSWIDFDQVDLVDAHGRLVGLHQLVHSKKNEQLVNFLHTDLFHILLIQKDGIWNAFSTVPIELINHVSNRIRDLEIINEILESFATGAFAVKERPKLKEKRVRLKSKKKTADRRKSCISVRVV